jgi:hypothetical protein
MEEGKLPHIEEAIYLPCLFKSEEVFEPAT